MATKHDTIPTAAEVLAMRQAANVALDEASLDASCKATDLYLGAVEALPLAQEHIAARAQALRVLYAEDLEALDDMLASLETTDGRLIRQIIMTLVRAG